MFTAADLHVIAVFTNPLRWRNRERRLREFIPHMLDSGVTLHLADHAFGERDHALADDDPLLPYLHHVKLRGGADHELWIKEALQKAVIRRLPEGVRYVALIDADVFFQRADWATETLHMLQHHRLGQPWSHAIDLDPQGLPMVNDWGRAMDRSFCQAWAQGDVGTPAAGYGDVGASLRLSSALLRRPEPSALTQGQHYGYAWAFRLETLSAIGGLPDWLVTGSADYHAALGFAGLLAQVGSDAYLSPACVRRLREFAARCEEHVRQDIGVVPGILHHGFHGSKQRRFYMDRRDILAESDFDPDRDLTHDWQGIPSLAGDNRILRDGLRRLGRVRNEDSSE